MLYRNCPAIEIQIHYTNVQMADPIACKLLLSSSFLVRTQKSTLTKALILQTDFHDEPYQSLLEKRSGRVRNLICLEQHALV